MVGHVPMAHTLSFMCTNHIVMTAHTPACLQVGEHPGIVAFPICIRTVPGRTRTPQDRGGQTPMCYPFGLATITINLVNNLQSSYAIIRETCLHVFITINRFSK